MMTTTRAFGLGLPVLGLWACVMAATSAAHAQGISVPEPTAATAVSAPPSLPRFEISAFAFEGATLLSQAQMKAATVEFLGPARGFSDVEGAVRALEAAFASAGIHAVRVLIPEQTLDAGVVKLQVVEQKIERIEVQGRKERSDENLRRAVPSLLEGFTPNDDQLAQELRLANESPSRQMQVTFRVDDDDSLTGVLRVADQKPLGGQLSLDNTGSSSTGQWRLSTALQHSNLLDRDIVGGLQFQTSPDHLKEVQIVSASARVPLYGWGWTLDVSAMHSSVDSGTVSTAAGNYFIASKGSQVGLKASWLLDRWGGWDPRWSLGLDVRNVDTYVGASPSGGSLMPAVQLRPLTLGWSALKSADEHTLSASVSLARNLPGSGNSSAAVFSSAALRGGLATPGYTILRANFTGRWPVATGFGLISWNGQWTRDALLPAEQFSIGGDSSVRGFNGRLASADLGHRLGLEWQSAVKPAPWAADTPMGWSVFADLGQVRKNLAGPGEEPTTTLASIGLGLRAQLFERISARADAGMVARGQGLAKTGDVYVHVAATYGF